MASLLEQLAADVQGKRTRVRDSASNPALKTHVCMQMCIPTLELPLLLVLAPRFDIVDYSLPTTHWGLISHCAVRD